ncbi:sensor histidine kinase [Anaerovorax odorimutans]|uniref:sensor histidine kinase n=1 Tax=Anaerovorax odorimutans TaxID=109327 RepID=UPI000429AF03|nr:histidine kinase [Anaerovorax odorimutans]
MNIKKKYYMWSMILIAFVFLVWGIFYYYLTELIQKNTQLQLNNTGNQIMKDLGDEFYNMEQITFTLSQSEMVKAFVSEDSVKEYYLRAQPINEMILGMISNESMIGSVITYNKEGVFYRFLGEQGNTECDKIYYMIRDKESPEHLVIKTKDKRLIGYGSGIYNINNNRIGAVVVLLDEEAILTRLDEYNQPDTLHISVAAKNEIVISDTKELMGKDIQDVRKNAYYYAKKHMGITPFSILVTADIGYLESSKFYFTVAALITGIALVSLLLIFGFAMRKYFFKPMIRVLESVEHLDLEKTPGSLSYIGSEEFDKLVIKLNEMLRKIDTKNKNIQEAMLLVKNTEIKRQKAIILSLKKQINAHFTVNMLNLIRILVTKKELERAVDLCDGLSMLVRYAHDEDEFINIWDEFYILQSYINIMNIRYNNKFEVNFDLDDRLMDYKMPRMLLQPIVENAVVHGYSNFKNKCLIDISAKVEADKISIHIRDEGEGLSEELFSELKLRMENSASEPESTGGIEKVAMININRRIGYYYGDEYGLVLKNVIPHGLEVDIIIGKVPKCNVDV